MARQQRFSPRDEVYLRSTRFEVYMVVGLVFLAGFTASFILSRLYHMELMLWPGALLSVVIAGLVLRRLKQREYNQKLHELEDELVRRQ
ncbi:MAG: hypothetical protein MUD01_16540 [Chloroflexaceae bacterium]|jgi:uncharacterized membrane protein YccC|nr:hypothetical protein [Chloroflexaceae bacterium]